ncbi:MAG: hypothetical protein HF978_11100 [Desulfobacteraceae bacterium]|nr:hypothetical protein [Desulfobacteraceae bacterium]MBC2756083.1 hypothetical protein [Desulfobacteraceae bacterium]
MNRIKIYIYTILTSAAFIYGSFLCTRHGEYLHDLSKGSLVLFYTGFTVIITGFIVINRLMKSTHQDSTFLQRITFSVCITLLIFMGTHLIALKPYTHGYHIFSTGNMAFYFGVYLVLFGVSFLHFLLKN